MKKDFLLSIIIPTKNREVYILNVIEQILQMNSDKVQVVIQDNGDTNYLLEKLLKYKENKCLKYNYTGGVISFVDNFNKAIDLADGEYLCIIGDDDGIVPQIVDVVAWAKDNGIDAIRPELNAIYFWPDSGALPSKYIDNGYLSINKITAKARLYNNPFTEVEKLLKQGTQKYLSLDMVKLYHGIVKKKCLDKIKNKTGKYIGGLSPDIYISVALTLTVDKMVKVDFPLTISGICSKSGSADSATGRHTGKLKEAPHFRGHPEYKWDKLVPEFYSVETIWADSALAAIDDLGYHKLKEKFNLLSLDGRILNKYPEFEEIILQHYRENSSKIISSKTWLEVACLKYSISNLIKKVIIKLKTRRQDILRVNGIKNIIHAGEVLQQRFMQIGLNIETLVLSLEKIRTTNEIICEVDDVIE